MRSLRSGPTASFAPRIISALARWQHPIVIDETAELPVFLQIARAIAEDARRGRLRAGDALPGSRTFATELGVHRNTVLAKLATWGVQRPGSAEGRTAAQ